jgi:hypothetical protein
MTGRDLTGNIMRDWERLDKRCISSPKPRDLSLLQKARDVLLLRKARDVSLLQNAGTGFGNHHESR